MLYKPELIVLSTDRNVTMIQDKHFDLICFRIARTSIRPFSKLTKFCVNCHLAN